MINLLKKIINRNEKKEDSKVEIDSDERFELATNTESLNLAEQYHQLMFFYQAGIRQIRAKLEILNEEFQCCHERNPIESIHSRIKSADSILAKMQKLGISPTINSLVKSVYDVGGVRVICLFLSDVYDVARLLMSQTDIEVIQIKDYIKSPKENGYRSLHVILMVDVYFSDLKRKVPIEIQFRTIAMNFWASLEHQLRYKKEYEFTDRMKRELKECAELIADTDQRMQGLADELPDYVKKRINI